MTARERPILFNGPMVRSILDGTKTMTRRIAKAAVDEDGVEFRDADGWPMRDCSIDGAGEVRAGCPYGVPGDRLWGREAWRAPNSYDNQPPRGLPRWSAVKYEADGLLRGAWSGYGLPGKLRPGMFMPRWASRILLEVTAVRVERLQDISDADAVAEGIGLNASAIGVPMTVPQGESMPRAAYRALWESINGAASWAANPYVWVVECPRYA